MKRPIIIVVLIAVVIIGIVLGIHFGLDENVNTYMEFDIQCSDFSQHIKPYKYSDSLYCVFLPSCKTETITCELFNNDTISIGDKNYITGSNIDVQKNSSIQIVFKKGIASKNIQYIFIPSSRVGTVFIDSESNSMSAVTKTGSVTYSGKADMDVDLNLSEKKDIVIDLPNPQPILGLGAKSNWILSSCSSDPTYMREKLSYDLLIQCGITGAAQSGYTDVYINGNYMGLYVAAQRNNEADTEVFTTSDGVEVINGSQVSQEFENSLVSSSEDEDADNKFSDYISMNDWALQYLVYESFFCYTSSDSFSDYYEKNGRIYIKNNYDYSFCEGDYIFDDSYKYLMDTVHLSTEKNNQNLSWYYYLSKDKCFYDCVSEKYENTVQPVVLNILYNSMSSYKNQISRAVKLDNIRWIGLNIEYNGTDITPWDQKIFELRKFYTDRQELLTDMWIKKNVYHNVTIIDSNSHMSVILSIPDGYSLNQIGYKNQFFQNQTSNSYNLKNQDGTSFLCDNIINSDLILYSE